ncbi:MAG TPA: outer membrane beta-barrel protein [Thermoanaerobaculia bacterium]|nr:outer membrane beta-barrel protein [Thermoanaerobaculia bacterium]
MTFRKRIWLGTAMALAVTAAARAQIWQVGASAGVVNAVENGIHLDAFGHQDVNGWVGYELDYHVTLLGTFGSLRTTGSNAGKSVAIGGAPTAPLPDLPVRVTYTTIGVLYEFWEGDFNSGLFAGFGGYHINPDEGDPSLDSFRDPQETVWGWTVGADASFRVAKRWYVIPRLTLHEVKSHSGRSLLTADIGVAYKF